MIRKIKDPYRWRTGFALFGATLDDGYFVLWRRFSYRIWGDGHQEACRYGMISEYEAILESRRLNRPPPPSPYTSASTFRHTFERLDEADQAKRFIHLTAREFDIFFSGIDYPASLKALAWSEFHHSVGGRMIKRATRKSEPNS